MSRRTNLIICALAVSVSLVCAVVIGCNLPDKPPVFVPPAFESRAMAGIPTVPYELGYSEIPAQDAFHASVCGNIIAQNGLADVYFTSSESNDVWLKLRISDANGVTLGETGLLRPGEYVQKVALNPCPPDKAIIKLKIMAYHQESYYSAGAVTLNTTIRNGE